MISIGKKFVFFLVFICIQLTCIYSYSIENEQLEGSSQLRILHITFHKGCKKEIDSVAKALNYDLVTWYIPDLPPYFFDGKTTGNALYNMGHDRAERIWNLHQDYFNAFDVVITSDTAPLSRIFLQNAFNKPLVIWICNRFDYCDTASLDCNFPDPEYYDLFKKATQKKNVKMVAYTAFEQYYARSKGIDIGPLIIKPCALGQDMGLESSNIPEHINKTETYILPPYHNEMHFMDFSLLLRQMGIQNYCGRYNGPLDLYDFKAIVHLPYAWSNLALFENMAIGIPYFIPSAAFFEKLAAMDNYFFPNLPRHTLNNLYTISEWYSKDHQEIFTFFDSWSDLKNKLQLTDFRTLRAKIRTHAYKHKRKMLSRWKRVFTGANEIACKFPYVIGDVMGQFGNQLFIIAATTSLALDNGAKPLFPGFFNPIDADPVFKLAYNHEHLFSDLDTTEPFNENEFLFIENGFDYKPISYQPQMRIRGWFQSEKYFASHKQEILDLFAPKKEILDYLSFKYFDILQHPQTVAVHVRKYSEMENPHQRVYYDCDMDYYEKAMSLFPEETLFLIFSNQMDWCKENFSRLNRNIQFIESEKFFHDFYLMSLCKHNIICNSTFSWWAAYLNANPDKKVIVPPLWFQPGYISNPKDLIPSDWIILNSLKLDTK